MAAARAPKKGDAYRVVGPLAVIRKDRHERYLDHGAVFGADIIDEANAEHLLRVGLIDVAESSGAPGAADTSDSPYKGWNADALKAELEKRNADREVKIVPQEPGNKPEILAALIADDAQSAS